MRILHVINRPRAEGTVRLVLTWLGESEWQQEVYSLNSTPTDLSEELKLNASWFKAELAVPSGVKKFPWMVARLREICRERRPDLVICWPNGFAAFVLLGARLGGVRRIV